MQHSHRSGTETEGDAIRGRERQRERHKGGLGDHKSNQAEI
jgi:hypothetical protein